MPGDTIHIVDQSGQLPLERYVITAKGDTFELPDSFYGTGGYYGWKLRQEQLLREEQASKSDYSGTIFFFIFIAIMFVGIGWHRIEEFFGWARKRRIKVATVAVDEKGIQYDAWLRKYNPYYNSLTATQKQAFMKRTVEFMQAKEFRFHAMVEEEYMPVLISAAAVQLTFGLRNYLLDYFPVIHIVRKEYTLNIDKETYYGHVSRNGIYISWNHFMEGYQDYKDSVNVGLHEMAHAIAYDMFLGNQDYHDSLLKDRLQEFRREGIPVFRAMRKSASHILDEYAATNFDEFWAVCVETFFENTEELRDSMPDLFQTICEVLNQNPLSSEKIINQELAN